jgi:DnaJ-class molecular chaperone
MYLESQEVSDDRQFYDYHLDRNGQSLEAETKFSSVKEFVNWLIDNEGKILADGYGRQWKYEGYGFKFKDIGTNDVFEDGLQCVHLFGTPIRVLS